MVRFRQLHSLVILLVLATPAGSAEDTTAPRWTKLDRSIVVPSQQQAASAAEDRVELNISTTGPVESAALDIGLAVLDAGLEKDSGKNRKLGIFPEIREAEARYLPYALRRTLVDSNQWGAVRVLPEVDPGYELLITGKILVSDGSTLSLQLVARDSRNQVWFDQIYTHMASDTAYMAAQRRVRRPFQDLYNQVANDLLAFRDGLSETDLRRIRGISDVRYAAALAPDAFASFLATDENGLYQLLRLPAREDPMMDRIARIREQEYLFIDTTDEQYADLYTEMTPVYDLWRQFQREQMEYREVWKTRRADREAPARGSFEAMKRTYNNFKWEKIQRQEMQVLAKGFDNELAPTSLDLQGSVVNLSGSLDERYREWRRILRQIYALETGA